MCTCSIVEVCVVINPAVRFIIFLVCLFGSDMVLSSTNYGPAVVRLIRFLLVEIASFNVSALPADM